MLWDCNLVSLQAKLLSCCSCLQTNPQWPSSCELLHYPLGKQTFLHNLSLRIAQYYSLTLAHNTVFWLLPIINNPGLPLTKKSLPTKIDPQPNGELEKILPLTPLSRDYDNIITFHWNYLKGNSFHQRIPSFILWYKLFFLWHTFSCVESKPFLLDWNIRLPN